MHTTWLLRRFLRELQLLLRMLETPGSEGPRDRDGIHLRASHYTTLVTRDTQLRELQRKVSSWHKESKLQASAYGRAVYNRDHYLHERD